MANKIIIRDLIKDLRSVLVRYENTSHILMDVRIFDTADSPERLEGWEEIINRTYDEDRHRLVISRMHKKEPIG